MRSSSGEVMIGPMGNLHPETGKQKPLLRFYFIFSLTLDETLHFYFLKVDKGALTSKLKYLKVGDQVILKIKSLGTLVHDAFTPAKGVWFFQSVKA